MKASHLLAGIAVCGAIAMSIAVADARIANSHNTTSVTIDDNEGKATIRGDGVANILGDKVEAKDGIVYVNGVSFGNVPAGAEVKYVVTKTSRSLLVDGKVRGPVDKK